MVHTPPAARHVVLVVDDEADGLEVLRLLLLHEGFQVITASSGAQAIEIARIRQVDLAIVDAMMPGMTGLELCEYLRNRPQTAAVPIILYSCNGYPQHAKTMLYDRAFLKPAEPDDIVSAVRSLLRAPKPEVEFTFHRPAEVDAASALLFKEIVLGAAQADPRTFSALYERALVIGFARMSGRLAGVGAIKRPNPTHRDKVFRDAQASVSPTAFVYELGWFHVLKRYEGNRICSRVLGGLMPWAEGNSIYATSASDNKAMHVALTRHGGFVREGSDHLSELRETATRLFVRHAYADVFKSTPIVP